MLNNDQVFDLIKERLASGNTAVLTVTGNSMAPLFKDGKTTVTLVSPSLPPKKYGIYLYKRANGKIVLHRAVKIGKSSASFRGDAERVTERDVPFGAIVAYAVVAETEGKKRKLEGTGHTLHGLWRSALNTLRRLKAHLTRKTK